jgi:hypothetical protein
MCSPEFGFKAENQDEKSKETPDFRCFDKLLHKKGIMSILK